MDQIRFIFPALAHKFPVLSQKFPVLRSREFHCKPLDLLVSRPSATEILRREIIRSHELQIVGQERGKKTEDLYSYITSPTFTQHLDSIQILTNKMRDLDAAEERAHKRLWKTRDGLIRSVQEAQGELRADVDQIVGTNESL